MVFHRWAGILLCLLGHQNTPGGCSVFYAVYSVVISIVLSLFWPVVQTGINNFGIWIANSSETSPILAPFIYGTLERLLLPFGLQKAPFRNQYEEFTVLLALVSRVKRG